MGKNDEHNYVLKANNWRSWARPTFYITGFFTINLVLTIHTKWLLDRTNFSFPWILSGLHIAVSSIGAWLTLRLGHRDHKYAKITKSVLIKIALFSVLYSLNIAMSNVGMKYVSLAFHQISRSATPFITLIMEFFMLGKVAGLWSAISLIPVVAGIVMTALGEFEDMNLNFMKLLLTLVGIVLSSLKGVVTNVLLVGGFKMHPLELIAVLGPFASIQCLALSIVTGETGAIYRQYRGTQFDGVLITGLTINACLAFLMNWISFAANKETSALAMTVAGNVKQAVSVALSVILFNTKLHVMNGLGIVITLLGGAWYSAIALNQKKKKKISSHLINSITPLNEKDSPRQEV